MKSVIVTGGSGGIGRAVCLRLAREGYAVCVGYSTNLAAAQAVSSEIRSGGGVAMPLQVELTDVQSIARAYETAVAQTGVPEVLVNNGGKAHIGLFTDMTDDQLSALIAADLTGSMLLTKRAAADMVRLHRGRIINIASVWGEVGASCETAYSAAKAGLIGFTRALGKELAPGGITVNCISPGLIDTPMNACLTDDDRAALIADIPTGRMGTPEEVAALAAFLCSDAAAYITSQVIRIDGSWI